MALLVMVILMEIKLIRVDFVFYFDVIFLNHQLAADSQHSLFLFLEHWNPFINHDPFSLEKLGLEFSGQETGNTSACFGNENL